MTTSNRMPQGANGSLKRTTAVCWSGASTASMRLVAVAGGDVVVGLHDRLPGVLHVGRGHRLAVVPGHVLAQLVGDRLAVG